MRRICRWVGAVVAVAGASMVAAGGAVAEPTQLIALSYQIGDMSANANLNVVYNSGVLEGSGGSADAYSGTIRTVILADNAMLLTASGDGLQQGQVVQYVKVASAPVAGVAHLPAGATVSLTNVATGQKISLANGAFSIPTGVKGPNATPRARAEQTVPCRGNGRSCQAQVSIAGGASNRTIRIRLTDTDLKLTSVKADPSSSKDAYSITSGHFKPAGSQYLMTLNAARADPHGAHLILRFTIAN